MAATFIPRQRITALLGQVQPSTTAVAAAKAAAARPAGAALQRRGFGSTLVARDGGDAKQTGLYPLHVRSEGKMVNFGGYKMPLAYGNVGQGECRQCEEAMGGMRDRGARYRRLWLTACVCCVWNKPVASHHHVRNECGLFDVGHMVQHTFTGPGALAFLENLVPTSLAPLQPWSSSLSVLLNDNGGIIDDLIISKQTDDQTWYVVTNAGRRAEDLKHFADKLKAWTGDKVEHTLLDGWGLVALQGPKAVEILSKHTQADLGQLVFGKSIKADVAGAPCHIARGGYTGEDGFEVCSASSRLTNEMPTC